MINMLEHIRRIAFWTFDYLKGTPIRKNYKEIKYILENPKSAKTKEIRDARLSNLLTHSTNTCNFYKKYKGYKSLNEFPVINKNVVLDNYEDFKSSKFNTNKLHKASSSGSTGIPFSIFHNETKKNRNTADTIYFAKAAGYNVGEKLIYLKLWGNNHAESKLKLFLKNIMTHDIMNSSDHDIASLISKIKKIKSSKAILGYPSFFNQLCNYLDINNVNSKGLYVKSIISFAESLNDYEREKMELYFNSKVYERYSNRENGILAQQTINYNQKYKLNWASYFFEILEIDSNTHVKSGKLGRIVITDLFNHAMPLIRYDTGDMAIYEEEKDSMPSLSKIFGRRADLIYGTNGEIISPFIFYRVLSYSKAKQFQFIQTNKTEYKFVLNGKKEDTNENEVVNYFKKYLGNDSTISFNYVSEIPVLSSGKRKEVRNDYMLKKSKN